MKMNSEYGRARTRVTDQQKFKQIVTASGKADGQGGVGGEEGGSLKKTYCER
jgi:hypothetical protein